MKPPLSTIGQPLQTHDERGPRVKRTPEPAAYYFGCANERVGHYYFAPGMEQLRGNGYVPGLGEIDGKYPPRNTSKAGVCTLTYVDGYSILAWWDYSVDKRPKSNSALIAKGTKSFDEMMLLLNAQFSSVADRQREPLKLTGTE